METGLTREEALQALQTYNHEPFHLQHALTVEAVMGWFAKEEGFEAESDFWRMAGLLHDIDFEQWPEQHCVKCIELLQGARRRIGAAEATSQDEIGRASCRERV